MFIKKLFLISLLFLTFSFQNANTEEIDSNLVGNRNTEKNEILPDVEHIKDEENTSQSSNEIIGSPFEEEIKKIEQVEEIKSLNEQQVKNLSRSLNKNYGDNFEDRLVVDNSLRRKKANYKLDIKVKEAKDSKIGSQRISMKDGYNAFLSKDYEVAIYHYRQALAEDPTNAEAAFGLGASYQMLLQYDQAIDMYVKLIKNNYARKKAVNNLLVALHHKTDKQSLEILQSIDANVPGYSDILSQIGIIHLKNKDYNSALTTLSKANDIAPDNALIAYNLGIVYDKLNNKDYAKHFYEQAIRNDIADIISGDDLNNLYQRVQQINNEITESLKKS